MKMFRTIGMAAAALLLFGACQSMTGETAGQNIDDSSTTTAVKAKLSADDKVADMTRVHVKTVRGIVTLDGVVPNEATKERVFDLATSVNGVRGVHNNLQIQAPSAQRQG